MQAAGSKAQGAAPQGATPQGAAPEQSTAHQAVRDRRRRSLRNQVVLVTGATSGIGRETALLLARLGHRVFATGRREEALAELEAAAGKAGSLPLETIRLDVTDPESLEHAAQEVDRRTAGSGLDALVNNAGFGTMAPVELTRTEEVRAQFETNVFGLLRTCQRFLPAMRSRGAGTIVNVSSVVGRVVLPLQGAYCATKHAVEALSDALRMEVASFGVRVVLVEPGAIATHFEATAMSTVDGYADSPYGPAVTRYGRVLRQTYTQAPGPACVARTVARVLRRRRPRARYVTPARNLVGIWLLGLLPTRWTDWVLRRVMGLTPRALAPARTRPGAPAGPAGPKNHA